MKTFLYLSPLRKFRRVLTTSTQMVVLLISKRILLTRCSTQFPTAQNCVSPCVTCFSRYKSQLLRYVVIIFAGFFFSRLINFFPNSEARKPSKESFTMKFSDERAGKLFNLASSHMDEGNYIKALEILEDLNQTHGKGQDGLRIRFQQGQVLYLLSTKADNPELEFAYLLGSMECYWDDVLLSSLCAKILHGLGDILGSRFYYKKSLKKAEVGLKVTIVGDADFDAGEINSKETLLSVIEDIKSKIASSKPLVGSITESFSQPKRCESKNSPNNAVEGLRSYWLGLDVKVKRGFMKVSITKLQSFVEEVGQFKGGREFLEQILASARIGMLWTSWICCSKNFSSAEDCKNHIEQEHAADFKPSSKKDTVKRVGKDWARKISIGDWEPVDTVIAVEMIKNQLAVVKSFASKCKNGWSKEWPLAVDEERGKLLKEIKLLLVSLCNHKTLSSSIRDWMMLFPLKHLGKFGISEQSLLDSCLVETPQSICFLECHELSQILEFLNNIKCKRDDGTDVVSRAVDSFLDRTRVKENIDFDPHFLYLLLDKRLLKSSNATLNGEGKSNVFDADVHYKKAHVQGDDIVSWLTDYDSVAKTFPISIREHNLDIWVAVLRAVQFTCRNLRTKYAKKSQALDYDAALTVIEKICTRENERRRSLQEDQWTRYACLLCDMCEEDVIEKVPDIPVTPVLFLWAVHDVLGEALHPTFDFDDSENCLSLIREKKSLSDDKVLKSIGFLKSVITRKVLLIDSKILLIDNSRISLLSNLVRLSVFDNRTRILQLIKPFLLNEIVNMRDKAKSDAAAAELSLEEEKKSQSKKKSDKRNKVFQRTSTSKSSPLDKTVEHKHSVDLKTVEEDSMKLKDALESESSQMEVSSKTQNQKEATKDDPDTQNLLGEDSLSANLESALGGAAARYSSALDMTLKALLNIKFLKEDLMNNLHPFQAHRGQQVPSALKNFFNSVVSEVIKNEGVYKIASLEESSSNAAKVVVAILEFFSCWKNPESQSMAPHLFTLVVNEIMSCRKCRRITNYPEQSSFVIFMDANSIRHLKCALESISFVDILKVIRMENQKSCDIETGGCGESNFVHHIIRRCPPIFTIVLAWENSETEKEISETTTALDWEIDLSRLYVGLKPNSNYRLVSMVGCGKEEEHVCVAYEKNRWVKLGRESLAGEDVGNWKSVVSFLGEMKVRPEILIYEAVQWMD